MESGMTDLYSADNKLLANNKTIALNKHTSQFCKLVILSPLLS